MKTNDDAFDIWFKDKIEEIKEDENPPSYKRRILKEFIDAEENLEIAYNEARAAERERLEKIFKPSANED
jgi:hypothetical protein